MSITCLINQLHRIGIFRNYSNRKDFVIGVTLICVYYVMSGVMLVPTSSFSLFDARKTVFVRKTDSNFFFCKKTNSCLLIIPSNIRLWKKTFVVATILQIFMILQQQIYYISNIIHNHRFFSMINDIWPTWSAHIKKILILNAIKKKNCRKM